MWQKLYFNFIGIPESTRTKLQLPFIIYVYVCMYMSIYCMCSWIWKVKHSVLLCFLYKNKFISTFSQKAVEQILLNSFLWSFIRYLRANTYILFIIKVICHPSYLEATLSIIYLYSLSKWQFLANFLWNTGYSK